MVITTGDTRLRRWPSRWAIRVARVTYLRTERSRWASLLRMPVVQRIKARITDMPATQVLATLDLVATAGVSTWVAGGWGIDALVGRQTRRHHDLDLVISDAPEAYLKVAEALKRAGYRPDEPELCPEFPMPLRCPWHRDDGLSLEVLPVALDGPPFNLAPPDVAPRGADSPFTDGRIDGRPVPCLSARVQLQMHAALPVRDITMMADNELLRTHVNRTERGIPA